jgi:hypothetical protein
MGSTVPIQPGETAILQNEQTGQYCQLRGLPSNSTQLGMFCDQPTPATATVMTYTGSGLSYQGQPLVAAGPLAPLLLSNTTTVPPGPMDDNLSFPPAGGLSYACVMGIIHVCVPYRAACMRQASAAEGAVCGRKCEQCGAACITATCQVRPIQHHAPDAASANHTADVLSSAEGIGVAAP